jgi:exonuclease SbcC
MSARLSSISISDFRSIRGPIFVPLDAPVVLIHGPNGSGKTSILSAIELALTGAVPSLARVEPDYAAHLVHKQARQGQVALTVTGLPGAADVTLPVTSAGFSGKRCYRNALPNFTMSAAIYRNQCSGVCWSFTRCRMQGTTTHL